MNNDDQLNYACGVTVRSGESLNRWMELLRAGPLSPASIESVTTREPSSAKPAALRRGDVDALMSVRS